MNKLKELEKEIKKQIPSILDLVFGCRIILLEKNGFECSKEIVSHLECSEEENIKFWKVHLKGGGCWDYTSIKIIGRPITFEDVLRLLSNILLLEIEFHGDCKLKFRLGFGVIKEPTDWVFWDLEKSLSQQKPETINFLYELICENNG